MKSINTTQDNEKEKSFFHEVIVALNSEKITLKKWDVYFNLLRGSMDGGLSLEHSVEFARALDNATVILNSESEVTNYNQSKKHLKNIIETLETLRMNKNSELIVPEIKIRR